jgi:hypothetical protein
MTLLPVDSLVKMPALPRRGASVHEWEGFVAFFHWDKAGDSYLSLAEVATAFAAALPVDEELVERFIRSQFDLDSDGNITRKELEQHVLPYLVENLDELRLFASARRPPPINRHSTRAELLAWFDFWDIGAADELERSDFRFAIARTFYQALGQDVDVETKGAAVAFFLSTVLDNNGGCVSRSRFIDVISPAIQANLP